VSFGLSFPFFCLWFVFKWTALPSLPSVHCVHLTTKNHKAKEGKGNKWTVRTKGQNKSEQRGICDKRKKWSACAPFVLSLFCYFVGCVFNLICGSCFRFSSLQPQNKLINTTRHMIFCIFVLCFCFSFILIQKNVRD
jgi:hypothetical protein